MYEGDELCIPAGAQAPSASAAVARHGGTDTARLRPPIRRRTRLLRNRRRSPRRRTCAQDQGRTRSATRDDGPGSGATAPAPTSPKEHRPRRGVRRAAHAERVDDRRTGRGRGDHPRNSPDDIKVRARASPSARRTSGRTSTTGAATACSPSTSRTSEGEAAVRHRRPVGPVDARTNIALAYQIYLRGGWGPLVADRPRLIAVQITRRRA